MIKNHINKNNTAKTHVYTIVLDGGRSRHGVNVELTEEVYKQLSKALDVLELADDDECANAMVTIYDSDQARRMHLERCIDEPEYYPRYKKANGFIDDDDDDIIDENVCSNCGEDNITVIAKDGETNDFTCGWNKASTNRGFIDKYTEFFEDILGDDVNILPGEEYSSDAQQFVNGVLSCLIDYEVNADTHGLCYKTEVRRYKVCRECRHEEPLPIRYKYKLELGIGGKNLADFDTTKDKCVYLEFADDDYQLTIYINENSINSSIGDIEDLYNDITSNLEGINSYCGIGKFNF